MTTAEVGETFSNGRKNLKMLDLRHCSYGGHSLSRRLWFLRLIAYIVFEECEVLRIVSWRASNSFSPSHFAYMTDLLFGSDKVGRHLGQRSLTRARRDGRNARIASRKIGKYDSSQARYGVCALLRKELSYLGDKRARRQGDR